MNQDQRQGKLEEFKARVKQEWAQLTDDEVKQVEGNYDELVAKIQQKYGDTKEMIAEKLNSFRKPH